MFRLRLRFYLLFLFIFVPGLVACSLASGGQPGSAAAPTATQVPANSTPTNTPRYTIGEQVPVGSWVITVEAYSSSGDTSYTPKAGSVLLIFTISQQNRGSRLATANGAVNWLSFQKLNGSEFEELCGSHLCLAVVCLSRLMILSLFIVVDLIV